MKNMLRQSFFVMRKKTSTYVILAIIFAFSVLTGFINKIDASEEPSEFPCAFTEIFSSCVGIAMLICGIYAVMYLGADLKEGFIKNITGNIRSRMDYIVPRASALAVFNFAVLMSLTAGSLVGSTVFLNGLTDFEAVPFLKFFGALCLLLTGYAMLLAFLVCFIRNTSGPMALAVFFGSGMFYNLFYGLLGMLLSKMGIEFDFSNVSVTMQIIFLRPNASNQEFLTACIIALSYILIFGFFTKLAVTKKDIA